MVEKTAGLAAEYGKGGIEEMWKVRVPHARWGCAERGDDHNAADDHLPLLMAVYNRRRRDRAASARCRPTGQI
jgi:hypothetical protein